MNKQLRNHIVAWLCAAFMALAFLPLNGCEREERGIEGDVEEISEEIEEGMEEVGDEIEDATD